MASSANTVSRQEATTLLKQIRANTLFNRQLTSICQVNGLKSTGVKAELQRRIIDLIEDAWNQNDVSRFQQIRQSINNAIAQRSKPSAAFQRRTTDRSNSPGLPGHSDLPSMVPHLTSPASSAHRPAPLAFKPSPFYQVEYALSSLRVCDAMAQHRNSFLTPIKMSDHPILKRCVDDKRYRVMVFCAGDNLGVQDIAFPHQAELKVNGDEIKANLRGVKNKPGSTRPVDITSALHLRSNYMNKVEFTYALTNKAGGRRKFYLLINLCKVTSVSELVTTISTRRKIPKASVIAELNAKAQDPDVVATSQVLSLKCPLSQMRLQVPCRSLSCTHIQCFDATSYLQLQEQGPQWLCPTCSKSAPFEQLAVDEYVRDILENTHRSLETVTIEPSGRWTTKSSQEETLPVPSRAFLADDDDDDDEDDDLEVSEISVKKGPLLDSPKRITPSTNTPVSTGIGTPRSIPPTSAKRPAPAVIDLTLSSDEDEEPIQRPNKRQNVGRVGFRSSGVAILSESSSDNPP